MKKKYSIKQINEIPCFFDANGKMIWPSGYDGTYPIFDEDGREVEIISEEFANIMERDE